MCVYLCTCTQVQIQEFLGAGITGSCELPDMDVVGPLQDQHSSEGLWFMGTISQGKRFTSSKSD